MNCKESWDYCRFVGFLLTHCLQLLISLSLFFAFLNKVFDRIAVEHFSHTENIIKIFLKLLSSLFNVFRRFISDPKYLLLGKYGQILDFTLFQSIMHVPQFAVPRFEGPFFMRIQISESYIVNDDILDQSVS